MRRLLILPFLAVALLCSGAVQQQHIAVIQAKRAADEGGGGAVTLTYKGHAQNNGTIPEGVTATDADIGSASGDRVVWLAVYWRAGTDTGPSSVTVGGNAANLHVSAQVSNLTHVNIYSLLVTTGTTATIDVAVGQDWSGLDWWITTGASATPYDTANSTTASTTIDTIADGSLIAASATTDDGTGGIHTWSGATERNDGFIGTSGFLDGYTTAETTATTTATGATVSVSSKANDCLAVLSIQPL
jgi:hypothetical protein